MAREFAGYAWLAEHFLLPLVRLRSIAVIGGRDGPHGDDSQSVLRFTPAYRPKDGVIGHLFFALKHEPVQLEMLALTFQRIDPAELLNAIRTSPSGRYARLACFLYEWLTGQVLPLEVEVAGGYVPVLDEKSMLVGAGRRDPRWRVLNNLSGTPAFCPTIRRTIRLQSLLNVDFATRIASFRKTIDPRLFERAIGYLYQKETRSSFAIERETLPADRAGLFLKALSQAGTDTGLLSEQGLVALQGTILDPRYVESGFRTSQNYVGEALPAYREKVHYVCPPPQFVASLMRGLCELPAAVAGIEPIAEAAMLSFGFVFIHPFTDGNGRIHRFLIHDVLARRAVIPKDIIVPVSAYMLRHPGDYTAALEAFGVPLFDILRYELDELRHDLVVENPDDVEAAYRYPDLTVQAEFLAHALRASVEDDLLEEVDFLRKYDAALSLVRQVVDMPDKRLSLLIRLLHENSGRLSRTKRQSQFGELKDDEVIAVQEAFAEAFGITRDLWTDSDEKG